MRNLLYRELSASRTLMDLRSWNFTVIGKYLGEWGVKIFSLGVVRGAQGPLMQIWDPNII